MEVLRDAGDLLGAGRLALGVGALDVLDELAVDLVGATVMAFPVDTGRSWLGRLPADAVADRPGLSLLAAAERFHRDFTDSEVDVILDRAAATLAERPPSGLRRTDAAAVVVVVGVLAAQARHDVGRLEALATSGAAAATSTPALDAARSCARATVLECDGDAEGALTVLDALGGDQPLALARLIDRTRLRCLLLAGRPAAAAVLARRAFAGLDDTHVRQTPALAMWLAGDPEGFADVHRLEEYERHLQHGGSRNALIGSFVHASIGASWGQVSTIATRLLVERASSRDNPRDGALAANAAAAVAVAAHDEDAAAAALATFRGPLADRRIGRSGRAGALPRGRTSSAPPAHARLRVESGSAGLLGRRRPDRRRAARPQCRPPAACRAGRPVAAGARTTSDWTTPGPRSCSPGSRWPGRWSSRAG